ncbi:unnamed protein product [Paramecium sonneborni]|uniref:Uncharacterized protein n=1 Tax=Paramecium sonneborni TaxID=65129 RepID=A0A8S1LMF4_9CILI|nr:unnamed protein product [Paramecium sonneborni]
MNQNQIIEQITVLLENQFKNIEQEETDEVNHNNKLVQALRNSNKIEIRNLKARLQQIYNNTIKGIVSLFQNEAQNFLVDVNLKNIENFLLIEKQKKKLNEYFQIIQDLDYENTQLRTQIQFKSSAQINENLILDYSKILNDLQSEIDEKNKQLQDNSVQLVQQEQLIDSLRIKIQNLEQQIKQENNQSQKIQKNNNTNNNSNNNNVINNNIKQYKEQATQIDMIEKIKVNEFDLLNQIQSKIKQQSVKDQYYNISKTVSLSVSRQLKQKSQDLDFEYSQFLEGETKNLQKQKNSFLSTNLNQQKIKMRKRQNLNDLYLYSKSQRNTNISVDHYYEPSILYRYNVLESIKK